MLRFFIFTATLLSFSQALHFEDRAACASHPDYPNTFQCGISEKCISIEQYQDGQLHCCTNPANCNDYTDEATYFNAGPNRHTLEKPGRYCFGHPSYPNTMQCAKTKRCIPIEQYRNGNHDCCGPNATTCDDKSDEDRVDPPGTCVDNPATTINGVQMGFQCAQTKQCLSQLDQPNGKCDCCGPQSNCSTCADHSDEDPCRPQDWYRVVNGEVKEKFSCAGTCRDISQLADNVLDCPYECVETGPGIRDQCRNALQEQQEKQATEWCTKLDGKSTPFITCPAMGTTKSIAVCVEPSKIRDGVKYECDDGADESTTVNPDCTAEEMAAHCVDGATQCVKINGQSNQIDCRCTSATGGQVSCNRNSSSGKRK